MNNNDVFRRLRYAIKASDKEVIEIFSLKEFPVTFADIQLFVLKEDEENFKEMSNIALNTFLDGLIVQKRGKKENASPTSQPEAKLTNNMILKKIRIALEFKEEDMLSIFKLGGFVLSKSELSALFRREGQVNYKELGDQGLRNFLKGLTIKLRGSDIPANTNL